MLCHVCAADAHRVPAKHRALFITSYCSASANDIIDSERPYAISLRRCKNGRTAAVGGAFCTIFWGQHVMYFVQQSHDVLPPSHRPQQTSCRNHIKRWDEIQLLITSKTARRCCQQMSYVTQRSPEEHPRTKRLRLVNLSILLLRNQTKLHRGCG